MLIEDQARRGGLWNTAYGDRIFSFLTLLTDEKYTWASHCVRPIMKGFL